LLISSYKFDLYQVVDTVNQISTCIQPTATAARQDASLLGRKVIKISRWI